MKLALYSLIIFYALIDWSVAADLEHAAPETVGVSSERLERLHLGMQALVNNGQVAGISTMIARRGKIIDVSIHGYQDLKKKIPLKRNTIFRIASMTKPITGVALMMLFEEGKFRLSDSVEKYIPEFKGLRVAVAHGLNGQPITEPADHPMTIRELMSHTSGLTYGIFSSSQVDELYVKAGILDGTSNLDEMIEKLSHIPLRQQPGSKWHYSVGVEVQGYLIEQLSGMTFPEFLRNRLFEPLGMSDTAFFVPKDKADRLTSVYAYDEEGTLVAGKPPFNWSGRKSIFEPPTLPSGGGGLVSTLDDYIGFVQMMVNGGELNGVRILSPYTVKLMSGNALGPEMRVFGGGHIGFGLDFAVDLDPTAQGVLGSKGSYYWGGALGTWFWIDPKAELVFVGMMQSSGSPHRPDTRSLSRTLTYQALVE
jgi:CubicO group peptidase (beta-lactamase class C family)